MAELVQVQTAAGSRDEADAIAAALVDSRLAACVQVVGPITSRYWWDGAVQVAEEWLCLAKTAADRYPEVEAAIRARHSYDVPEIFALSIVAGSPSYLDWVTRETDRR
ncbi:MAG: periplasmic divalent cation tolerance protein [Actinomycetota bacterium]|jgi:periplasmic divalent cation tolerance protein|nr:periplasmic divalent cation tolerance protein [Actinomycetota bacterium]